MFGHATYLVFELAWGVPVLALQWIVGWRALRVRRAVLALAVLIPTVYLSFADAVAIANRIWTLHASRICGLHVGNVPIEEIVFFALTNAMVVQTVVIVYNRSVLLPLRSCRDLFSSWRLRKDDANL